LIETTVITPYYDMENPTLTKPSSSIQFYPALSNSGQQGHPTPLFLRALWGVSLFLTLEHKQPVRKNQ
jgi:hypothetical protein